MPMVTPDSPPGHWPGWSRSSNLKMRSRALSLSGSISSSEHRGGFALDGALHARLERARDQRQFAVDDHLAVGDLHRAAGLESFCRAGEDQPVAFPLMAGLVEVVPVLPEELRDALVDLAPRRFLVRVMGNDDSHGEGFYHTTTSSRA